MSPNSAEPEPSRKQVAFNLALAAVTGQVGCLTTLIVVAALFGGLWVDSRFQTRPMFTILFLLVSVPFTLVMMFWVVRKATASIKPVAKPQGEPVQEESKT